ncbi:unnamed protein product [Victoria cruziana]
MPMLRQLGRTRRTSAPETDQPGTYEPEGR